MRTYIHTQETISGAHLVSKKCELEFVVILTALLNHSEQLALMLNFQYNTQLKTSLSITENKKVSL